MVKPFFLFYNELTYETPAGLTMIPSLRPSPHCGGNVSGVMPATNRQASLSRSTPHRSADSCTSHDLPRTKRQRRFDQSGNHLLAYLAITRQSRIQLGQKKSAVQGCFSDRERCIFMAIRNDGSIRMSNTPLTSTCKSPGISRRFSFSSLCYSIT